MAKTRREFVQDVGRVLTARALARLLPLGAGALLWPQRAAAMVVTLDPANPTGTFTQAGTQTFTPGAVLTLTDASVSDFIAFFAQDPDANPGLDTDLTATFQVQSTGPNNADAGNRVVINDAQSHAAIAACVVKVDPTGTLVRGIGLQSLGQVSDPATYPVFVPVDWVAAPVSLHLRRYANGDAELLEVNGVAPSPRALLPAAQLPAPTRTTFASVEFGCASPEATCTVAYSAFTAQPAPQPVAGTLQFTRFRLHDTDSPDLVRFRADYVLGAGSNGIDPGTQPVTIRLSTPGVGQFYPAPDFNPLNGFSVQGTAPKRRWTLMDSERARTGIEQLLIDEGPNNTGSVFLRDSRTNFLAANFSTVNAAITIGTGATGNSLTGAALLNQNPAGSGKWTL